MTVPASFLLCNIFTFFLDGNPLISSAMPRGCCLHCCQITERQDIKFLLYTNENPRDCYQLYLNNDGRLADSNFDMSLPLVVYIHGYAESTAYNADYGSQHIKDAFLKAGDYNVVLVDWSPLAVSPWYIDAVHNSPKAGRYTALFLRYLIDTGFPKEKIHVIGFSLGAEVAGYVGEELRDWGMKLPRITGLDPALSTDSRYQKLDASLADFVDVIHTDGNMLGNGDKLGHADFYPNGGVSIQKGCIRQQIEDNHLMSILLSCSHQRAWQYFMESVVDPTSFPAESCDNCDEDVKAYMGMGADKRLRGKFYLSTRGTSPFGKNSH